MGLPVASCSGYKVKSVCEFLDLNLNLGLDLILNMNPSLSEKNDFSSLINLIKTLQATIENLNVRLESFEKENKKANLVIKALNLRIANYEKYKHALM